MCANVLIKVLPEARNMLRVPDGMWLLIDVLPHRR